MPSEPRAPEASGPDLPEWVRVVIRKVESLAFGVVQVIVHDGRVTQIEVTEKTRFDERPPRTATPR
jgi:hypothetical protein